MRFLHRRIQTREQLLLLHPDRPWGLPPRPTGERPVRRRCHVGKRTVLGGFLDAIRGDGDDAVPIIAASAPPSGPVQRTVIASAGGNVSDPSVREGTARAGRE